MKYKNAVPVNPVGALHQSVQEILGPDVVDRAGVRHLSQDREEGGVQRVLNEDIWSIEIGSDNHFRAPVFHFLVF